MDDGRETATVSEIPSPTTWLGFAPGADGRLARWPQLCGWFQALADASPRVRLWQYGVDSGGQPLLLLALATPQRLDDLPRWQAGQQLLADPRRHTSAAVAAEVEGLLAGAPVVVLLTAGVHATEVGATLAVPDLLWELATSNEPWVQQVLQEVLLLVVPALNPGGLEYVADWHEATRDTASAGSAPPGLYHPWAGHDLNRDWALLSQPETQQTVSQVLLPWLPQITLDLHQLMVDGPRYVLPPYIDPWDPHVEPLLRARSAALGQTMAAEMMQQGLTGVATAAIFDAWAPSRAWGLYHGGVRILAEAASVYLADPAHLPRTRLRPTHGFYPHASTWNHPLPWPGGDWRLQDIVTYHHTAARALLRSVARERESWLRGFLQAQQRAVQTDPPAPAEGADPATPIARSFVIPAPAQQRDPQAVHLLADLLQAGGVEVEVATTTLHDTQRPATWPAGSLLVRAAQPFGSWATTLLSNTPYPTPTSNAVTPYDATAHSLPLAFGVRVVPLPLPLPVLVPVPAPLPTVSASMPPTPPTPPPLREVTGETQPRTPAAMTIVPATATLPRWLAFDSAHGGTPPALHRLLTASGAEATAWRMPTAEYGLPRGAWLLPTEGVARSALADVLSRVPIDCAPQPLDGLPSSALALRLPRVGVYSTWVTNSTDDGWTRFVLHQAALPFATLRDADLRAGNLRAHLDVLILPSQSPDSLLRGLPASTYPDDVAGGIGDVGLAALEAFVRAGGTLIALSAAGPALLQPFNLPLRNVLSEGRGASASLVPGAFLRLLLDAAHPLAWGYGRDISAFSVTSPAYRISEQRRAAEVTTVGRWPLSSALLGGWWQGGQRLRGATALVEVPCGPLGGRLILFGFHPQFRAQTRATFGLLFNAIWRSAM